MDAKFGKKSLFLSLAYLSVAAGIIFLPSLFGGRHITDWYLSRFLDYMRWSGSIYHLDFVLFICLSIWLVRRISKEVDDESVCFSARFYTARKGYLTQKSQREARLLNDVRTYSISVLSPYVSSQSLQVLLDDIERWNEKRDCPLQPVTLQGRLATIDLRHYVWNIGERLGWSGLERANFVKLVFPKEMKDQEIDTIRRNFRQRGPCQIAIDDPDDEDLSFHF
jgi:hypothetical protein